MSAPDAGNSILTVQVNGSGSIIPNRDGQILKIGASYSMTAAPSAGNVFAGWTGTVDASTPTINFTMQNGMTLKANFIPNPFATHAGTFRGTIQSDPPSFAASGFFRITTTASGLFSGRIVLGSAATSISGKFQADGSFTKAISIPGYGLLNLNLQLHLLDASDQITGAISNASFNADLSGDRATFGSQNPAPYAGRYTIILPSAGGDAPFGTGYGTVVIDTYGNVRTSGSLADGAVFSQGTTIGKTGTWSLFAGLYGAHGSISGPVMVQNLVSSDMDAQLFWSRPVIPSARYFPNGFNVTISLLGSTYTAPSAGTRILDLADTTSNALIGYMGGGVMLEIDQTATLNASNQITIDLPGEDHLRLGFNLANGLFSGTFINPDNRRLTVFRGVVFQKQNIAAGYFLGTSDSGVINISPNP